jgi:hypothetical protein
MSYQQNGKIEASDINVTLAGAASAAAASTTLNAVWGTGSGDRGYGQTPFVPNVTAGSKITAAAWNNLVSTTNTINGHQGLTLPVTPIQPVQNALINYDSGYVKTNIDAVNTNRLFAKLQGIGATTTAVNNVVWTSSLTYTFVVAFPSGNQARHFFNAGGQLSVNFMHPAGSAVGSRAVNLMFSQLCTACGTVVMSAMSTGSASIGGGSFTGITKVGGTGTPTTIDNNKGYYGLSTAYQTVFRQKTTSSVPGYYADSFIQIKARTNGATGANGDNGSIVYIQVEFDQVPDGAAVSTGTTVYLTATPPAQAGVTPGAFLPVKSWEMPTVTFTTAAFGVAAATPSPTPSPAPSPSPTPSPTPAPTPSVATWVTNVEVIPDVAFPEIRPSGTTRFRVTVTGWNGSAFVSKPPSTTLQWSVSNGGGGFVASDAIAMTGSVVLGGGTTAQGYNFGEFTVTLKSSTVSTVNSIMDVAVTSGETNVISGGARIRFRGI